MPIAIDFASADPTTVSGDVLAVLVPEGPLEKHKVVQALDQALGGALLAHAKTAEFSGKAEQLLDLPVLGRLPVKRLILAGLGAKRDVHDARIAAVVATVARASASAASLVLVAPERAAGASMRAVGEGLVLGAYRFTRYLTGDRRPKTSLAKVTVVPPSGRGTAAERKALALGAEIGEAVGVARDAVNEPPNVVNPEALAEIARGLAKQHGFKLTVLDKKGIEKAGMKLHYAVGQGSAHEPRFIHLAYVPKRANAKLAFVGKGLTFDSGGLCIKPAPGMGEMKGDMAGAAAVLGLMAAIGAARPNVEVHGIVGAAENMPDGAAYRPGDIFGSLDGKTVEIVNTDAEGRLVLADALTYAARLEPDAIIDAATLTGACVIALGKTCSAYYTADGELVKRMDRAALAAGEQFWRMPLLEELREQLKSDVADLKHTADRWGGSISAALFLREFVGKVPWVHCDVAGPTLADKAKGIYPKGGTGHPVLTFLRLVESYG
ncbi:MAG: leucyl aminopeptidase [Polyangiaceae bacterium]|nr:leucyl aminopeptidase [Polyangiaceae bacterium]